MARIERPPRALRGRGAQVASMTASHTSAVPPALGPCSRSLVALVGGLAVLLSSVNVLLGGATLPVDIPGVAVNRVAAASVAPIQDTAQDTGNPRFLFTAIDSIVVDHGGGPVLSHDHLGAAPSARFSPNAESRRQTNRTAAGLATELARGTRAESAHLATIETRRDDPRALLLRTAAWSRERGRSNA
jgi:hypothetical protein